MGRSRLRFASLSEAVAALDAMNEPMVLTRFEKVPSQSVAIAVNAAAAAIPYIPAPGEHPDMRRDRAMTADVELDYLYRQLVERGHARQVLSLDGGHYYELEVTGVVIDGDDGVYGFACATPRDPPPET